MMHTCREGTIDRRAGESFLIGDAIEVRVERVERGRVRLRCWIPGCLTLAARETMDEVAEENRRASRSRIPSIDDLVAIQEEA
jgi:sRNA-binding carbon storage regulator CsrA